MSKRRIIARPNIISNKRSATATRNHRDPIHAFFSGATSMPRSVTSKFAEQQGQIDGALLAKQLHQVAFQPLTDRTGSSFTQELRTGSLKRLGIETRLSNR